MPKYRVYASEVVYYMVEVEAESREEAVENACFGNEWTTPYDGDNFSIEQVDEVENA